MKSPPNFHQDERGQVSVLFAISSIALIFLIALIFNTSRQTTRKIEMGGAADAAALAGGTETAHALNAMTVNNNAMAEMLSVMIVTRSALQSCEIMSKWLPIVARAWATPWTAWIAAGLMADSRTFATMARGLRQADQALNRQSSGAGQGAGWLAMRTLDADNVVRKISAPVKAVSRTSEFARRNGADRFPHGWLIPGAGTLLDTVPLLPVGRGLSAELVDRAEEHQLKPWEQRFRWPLTLAGPFALIFSFPNQRYVFDEMLYRNKAQLRGKPGNALVARALNFLATEMLDWPDRLAPRPMLLTDDPSANPLASFDRREAEASLVKVRKYLQYLALAAGRMERESAIGGASFPNPGRWQSIAYAEADVYNPTRWRMFEQDWRVKIAPAVVLNERFTVVAEKLGLPGAPLMTKSLVFVNNH